MTLFDFSQSIRALNNQKKFFETLKFFKDNKMEFKPEDIGLNKFVVYEMISALIETNKYEVIFTFIHQYNVVLDEKNFGYLIKKFKDKQSINWIVVDRFCDLVLVENLDIECKTIEIERKGEKKIMELASDKENWYAFKTKALFETKQYQKCFELSKIALETFEKFHYSNEIWFARRIALSKKHLGNSADALHELLQVLRRKKEWFIQAEVAEIYKENSDFDKAFKYAIEAINNFGNLEYKIGLLLLIANILEHKQEKELAFKHYMLSKLLRLQEDWKVPNKLNYALQNLGFDEIPLEQISHLIKELKKYWNSFKSQKIKQYNEYKRAISKSLEGEIIEIRNDNERGKDGFLKNDGRKYYFSVPSNFHLTPNITIGQKVYFEVLPPTERKREQAKIKKIVT